MKIPCLTALLLLATWTTLWAEQLRYVRVGDETVAAVVSGSAALVHTGQILSMDEGGRMALVAVDEFLNSAGADVSGIVKLNVVASTPQVAEAVRREIAKRYPADARPPVSYVVGQLPHGQKLGIDAVALLQRATGLSNSAARTLRAGPRIYVSGQAEKGSAPAEAAAKTLARLIKTLEFVGSKPADVVQLKCFLTPMSAAPDVMAELHKVFGKQQMPFVFVEWKSDLPIEIELVATAPPAAADAPPVEYFTPTGLKPSPLFARIVRVNRGDFIYTAGLYSSAAGTGVEQVTSIFEQLTDVLGRTGGDLRHLAKATYYVGDDDASKQLNVLRPKYYDPQRPPAASKAMVPGVGHADRSISIDMIGVVVPAAKP